MKYYKILVIALCISNISNDTHAMRNETAKIASFFSAATVGAASLLYQAQLIANNDSDDGYQSSFEYKNVLKTVTFFAAPTIITFLIAHSFFYSRTPEGLLNQAQDKIKELDESLVKISQEQALSTLLAQISHHYLTSELPLVNAFHDLIKLKRDSFLITNLLTKAHESSAAEEGVKNKCEKYLQKYNSVYFANIEQAVIGIKEQPNFLRELGAQQLIKTARGAKADAVANEMNAMANTVNAATSVFSRK